MGIVPKDEADTNPGLGKTLRFERELRIGVLANPRSGTTGQDVNLCTTLVAQHKRALLRQVVTPDDVATAVKELADREVHVLAVSGGDGTLQAVLTALFRDKPFEVLPPLALLAAGTTNLTAADVGLNGNPVRALQRLLAWSEEAGRVGQIARRAVLRVHNGACCGPLYGMFFNAAGIVQITRARWETRRRAKSGIGRGGAGTTVMVGEYLLGLALGRRVVAPTRIGIRLDGQPLGNSDYLALLVTTLVSMSFGIRPYWGEGPGPLKFTAIAHKPKHLILAAPSLIRGKPNRYLQPEFGYLSRNINEAVLELDGECALDGEIITRDPRHTLVISHGGEADFLRL